MPVSLQERFWSKVKIGDSCWEWMGSLDKDGYGHFSHSTRVEFGGFIRTKRTKVTSHRMAYELWNKKSPDFMLVLHTCDNTCCVRPDHLFLGDEKDNAADMINKGRKAKRKGYFSKEVELEIKNLYLTGKRNQYQLAEDYGVVNQTISNICRRNNQ